METIGFQNIDHPELCIFKTELENNDNQSPPSDIDVIDIIDIPNFENNSMQELSILNEETSHLAPTRMQNAHQQALPQETNVVSSVSGHNRHWPQADRGSSSSEYGYNLTPNYMQQYIPTHNDLKRHIVNSFKGFCYAYLSRGCNKNKCRNFFHHYPNIELDWESPVLKYALWYAKCKKYFNFVTHICVKLLEKAQQESEWLTYFRLLFNLWFSPDEIAMFLEGSIHQLNLETLLELMNSCAIMVHENSSFIYIFKHFWDHLSQHLVRSVNFKPFIIETLLVYCIQREVDDFFMKLHSVMQSIPPNFSHRLPNNLITSFFNKLDVPPQADEKPGCSRECATQKWLPHLEGISEVVKQPRPDALSNRKSFHTSRATEPSECSSRQKLSLEARAPVKLKRIPLSKPVGKLIANDTVLAPDFQNMYKSLERQSPSNTAKSDKQKLQESIEIGDTKVTLNIMEIWASKASNSVSAQNVFNEFQSMFWNTDVDFSHLLNISDYKANPIRKRIISNYGMNKILNCMAHDKWDEAFNIYKWMQHSDVCIEETQVMDKSKTTCTKILSCAELCIRSGKLTDAIKLLESRNLFSADSSKWIVQGSEEDAKALHVMWSHILQLLVKRDVQRAYCVFMEICSNQQVVDSDLIVHGVTILVKLLECTYYEKAVDLYSTIEDVSCNYLDAATMRMLLVALVQLQKEQMAKSLFYKATMLGHYPHIKTQGNVRCAKVLSYMTKEEMVLAVKHLLGEMYLEAKDNVIMLSKYVAKVIIEIKELENDKHQFRYLQRLVNSQQDAHRRVLLALKTLTPPITTAEQGFEDGIVLNSQSVLKHLLHIRKLRLKEK